MNIRERTAQSGPARNTVQKVAIVTGGAGAGIGHGITLELAEAGWTVLIIDRDGVAARSLVTRLRDEGKAAAALELDVTSNAAAEQAVAEVLRHFGRLDGLVNSAGIGLCKPIEFTTDEEVMHLFSVDYLAAFRFTRAALPELRKTRGAIVNIGSVHARFAHPTYAVYASAKAALEALTRGIAIENGLHGVRANCVHPGYVESPQNFELIQKFTNGAAAEWLARYFETKQCLRQPVTPEQVGGLVTYLMSAKAATITGQSFFIDGGTSIMLFEGEPSHENQAH